MKGDEERNLSYQCQHAAVPLLQGIARYSSAGDVGKNTDSLASSPKGRTDYSQIPYSLYAYHKQTLSPNPVHNGCMPQMFPAQGKYIVPLNGYPLVGTSVLNNYHLISQTNRFSQPYAGWDYSAKTLTAQSEGNTVTSPYSSSHIIDPVSIYSSQTLNNHMPMYSNGYMQRPGIHVESPGHITVPSHVATVHNKGNWLNRNGYVTAAAVATTQKMRYKGRNNTPHITGNQQPTCAQLHRQQQVQDFSPHQSQQLVALEAPDQQLLPCASPSPPTTTTTTTTSGSSTNNSTEEDNKCHGFIDGKEGDNYGDLQSYSRGQSSHVSGSTETMATVGNNRSPPQLLPPPSLSSSMSEQQVGGGLKLAYVQIAPSVLAPVWLPDDAQPMPASLMAMPNKIGMHFTKAT